MSEIEDYFIYAGKKSLDYGVKISGDGTYKKAHRDITTVAIPGRSGEITVDNGRYCNVSVSYSAYLIDDFIKNIDEFSQVMNMQAGYQRLEDSFHPDVYMKARRNEDFDPTVIANESGSFTINFDCMPQRWLKSGETPVTFTSEGSITNPTSQYAKPLITVTGTGVLSVNGTIVTINKNDTTITLDCEAEDAYTGVENKNGDIYIDDFPTLQPGVNAIIPAENMTVEITPRWWKL
jgi:phage-related protein